MRRTITIGSEQVEMAANAASPFVYHKIFGKDFLKITQKDPDNTEVYGEMAFVMTKQAEIGELEMMKGAVTETDFITWLTKFDPMDMIDAMPQVVSLYVDQRKGTAVPKPEAD